MMVAIRQMEDMAYDAAWMPGDHREALSSLRAYFVRAGLSEDYAQSLASSHYLMGLEHKKHGLSRVKRD